NAPEPRAPTHVGGVDFPDHEGLQRTFPTPLAHLATCADRRGFARAAPADPGSESDTPRQATTSGQAERSQRLFPRRTADSCSRGADSLSLLAHSAWQPCRPVLAATTAPASRSLPSTHPAHRWQPADDSFRSPLEPAPAAAARVSPCSDTRGRSFA